MNALQRMNSQHNLVTKVIERLNLTQVFLIKFWDHEISIQTEYDELADVEGANPKKLDDGFYIRMDVDGVEIRAYREFTEEERNEEEQKNASA